MYIKKENFHRLSQGSAGKTWSNWKIGVMRWTLAEAVSKLQGFSQQQTSLQNGILQHRFSWTATALPFSVFRSKCFRRKNFSLFCMHLIWVVVVDGKKTAVDCSLLKMCHINREHDQLKNVYPPLFPFSRVKRNSKNIPGRKGKYEMGLSISFLHLQETLQKNISTYSIKTTQV